MRETLERELKLQPDSGFAMPELPGESLEPRLFTSTYYDSAPFTCTTGPWCAGDYAAGKPWTVQTYDHSYIGWTSVTNATLHSDSTIFAQLTLDVGPEAVDLYDAVSDSLIQKDLRGRASFTIPSDAAKIVVLAPAGKELQHEGKRTLIDGVVVRYTD